MDIKKTFSRITLVVFALIALESCNGLAHIFYDPNKMCETDKRRKGKFKQSDADRRQKSEAII